MASKVENACHDLPTKYKSVLDAVCLAHDEQYTIEILLESHSLPDGIFTIIDDESHSIGIPRRVLKDAAHIAWQDFFHVDAALEDQFTASSIILLANPEHMTAANARKRFVLQSHERDEKNHKIMKDLCFLRSLFMSPLHRHTKSPTIWAHHEWLIKQLDVSARMQAIDIYHLQIYLRAAEIHPKNVYAWQYLRYRISDTPGFSLSFSCSKAEGVRNIETGEDVIGMQAIISYFLAWCLRHVSDTSGWSFLLWLLIPSPALSQEYGEVMKWQVMVFGEVLRTATGFGFENEAVWVFLRTMASSCSAITPQLKADFRRSAAQLFAGGRDVENWLSVLSK